MDKVSIIAYAESIGRVTLDADTIDTYYTDTLEEIARHPRAPLLDIELFVVTSGTGSYTIPSDGVQIRALFHHSRELSYATIAELEAYDDAWRALSEDPYFYTTVEKDARTFQLVPEPDATSAAFAFTSAAPFGEDFPTNAGTIIYTERRDVDLPEWIGIYIAFRILAREFARESNHQDIVMSDACTKFALALWDIGGMR